MAPLWIIPCLLFVASSVSAHDKWTDLKVTFGNPLTKFNDLPRAAIDAEREGWSSMSNGDCSNGGSFNGHRYIFGDDTSLSLLYDNSGIIAGLQMNLLKAEIVLEPNSYEFENVAMFVSNTVKNQSAYSLTAYFVPPDSICKIKRIPTIRSTGTQLVFQNGPTPAHLFEAPFMRPAAIAEGWTQNQCFVGMGAHNFYKVDEWQASDCNRVRPVFLLYDVYDELHGFGFATITHASSENERYEYPGSGPIKAILGEAPQCILDRADGIGLSTMHLYFVTRPAFINCWF